MLEGLEDEELERYLEENPQIVPLFEIDVRGTADSYVVPNESSGKEDELGENALAELQRAQEVFDREKVHLGRNRLLHKMGRGQASAG